LLPFLPAASGKRTDYQQIRKQKGDFTMKKTVPSLLKMKQDGTKISMVTAYDYTTASLVDASGIDTILVGDSLGMTMMGYPDTLSVTMDDMIHHTRCVTRGAENTFVIGDMPFLSYQTSIEDAVYNAGRFMKEGRAQAVKLEGGAKVCPQIRAITDASIPVCAHLGLTPQSLNAFGGFKVQGKNEKTARQLIEDAHAIEEAGAFMVVLECVPARLAALISKSLSIPTIGIGAGSGCDGQVLVYQDLLGMTPGGFKPKFVKVFADIGEQMKAGFRAYDEEVKSGAFPSEEHTFRIDDELMAKLESENHIEGSQA
jgi:3-methyl-2-oxobutanoate hydroxymethyltransferase